MRALWLSATERERLASVWAANGRGPLRIDPADLLAASNALRSEVPDLVLAILIAERRSLGQLAMLTESVRSYYAASGERDWERAVKLDHVAFAELTEAASAEPVYACFQRTRDPKSVKLVAWDLRKPIGGGAELRDVDEYLARRLSRPAAGIPAASPEVVSAFQPVIESAPAPPPAVVHHPKFGEGKVIERLEGGKLRIDFGPSGIRVLLSALVTTKS
jgi:hypothetical protein